MDNKENGPERDEGTLKGNENSSPTSYKISKAGEELRSPGQQLMGNPSFMQPGSALPSQYPVSLADTEGRDCNESDRLYFFYGSLMDSGNLAWILDLAKEPKLRPARIEGYRTMLWVSSLL